jgi:hypothetical protein
VKEPTQEFDQIVTDLLDGSPAVVNRGRLCELMRGNAGLVDRYVESFHLHALLHWRAGRAVPTRGETPICVETTSPAVEVSSRQLSRLNPERVPGRRKAWAQAVGGLALLCMGIGLGVVLNPVMNPPQEQEAIADPLEELVGWSLDIAQAQTPQERKAIYETQANSMRELVAEGRLAPEEKELAQELMDTGAWLAGNDDPVAEAERFGAIADKLLVRLNLATAGKDKPKVVKLANAYQRLNDVGVTKNLDRALAALPHDPKKKHKLDHVIANDGVRVQRLEEMLERHQDTNAKAINRALRGHRRHPNQPPKP